jgi:acetyl esterase/lipase
VARATEREIERMGYPLALPASWAVMLGTLFRTGVDVTAADPILHVDAVGPVRVLVLQGDADRLIEADAAELLATEAQDAGVTVEVQRCAGAEHGRLVETCAAAYHDWVLGFLAR